MRENCRQTLDAWVRDEPYGKRGDSIWTDGDTIYSYDTWIVAEALKERRVNYNCQPHYLFNGTEYSTTTSIHQNAIREFLENNFPENFSETEGVLRRPVFTGNRDVSHWEPRIMRYPRMKIRPPHLCVYSHNERPDGGLWHERTTQEEVHFQQGWRRATGRLWPEVLRLRRVEAYYDRLLRKLDHGCTDAHCGRCDA